ncbi:Uncharacterised protein [Mycoplasmopsis edwardii]|uniref:Uncharacterized protein n=1 Tax=Mycoplasmopsis edwardii TaxID=53558 RepID=A0A3B0PP74_9BACT|nr:Uncharacterised protein [Mycoplasmopsis edwardii]
MILAESLLISVSNQFSLAVVNFSFKGKMYEDFLVNKSLTLIFSPSYSTSPLYNQSKNKIVPLSSFPLLSTETGIKLEPPSQ